MWIGNYETGCRIEEVLFLTGHRANYNLGQQKVGAKITITHTIIIPV